MIVLYILLFAVVVFLFLLLHFTHLNRLIMIEKVAIDAYIGFKSERLNLAETGIGMIRLYKKDLEDKKITQEVFEDYKNSLKKIIERSRLMMKSLDGDIENSKAKIIDYEFTLNSFPFKYLKKYGSSHIF